MTRSSDVPGTAAGFIFQFVRALYWLAKIEKHQSVGVEHIDDVSVLNLKNSVSISEQDKLTLSQQSPLADRSVNLWKTLANWTRVAAVNPGIAQFVLATNSAPSETSLVWKMEEASSNDSCDACIIEIRKLASRPSETNRRYMEAVTDADDIVLRHVIRSFSLDVTRHMDDMKDATIRLLPIPEATSEDDIYEALLGWLTVALMSKWESGNMGIISRVEFSNCFARVLTKNFRDVKPRTWSEVKPEVEVATQKGQGRALLFVDQMSAIGLEREEILDGVRHYVAEKIEITRLIEGGEIVVDDHVAQDDRYYMKWKMVFFQKTKKKKFAAIDVGQDVFYTTIGFQHDHTLASESYLVQGAYHRLANNYANSNFLGWHPDFREKFGSGNG